MSVYMVTGPILLVIGLVLFAVGVATGAFAFWRWRDLAGPKFVAMILVTLFFGVSVTGAGYAPVVPERFTVSDLYYSARGNHYTVYTTDGREITVPEDDGVGLEPGDAWTCRIRKVPVTHQRFGDCFDGSPA